MPFVTTQGGLVITDDIIRDETDHKTGQVVKKGNGFLPLQIAFGAHCDYNPNSTHFKKTVRRGNPNYRERHWVNGENPVWRIPHEDFSEEDQQRLVDFFKRNVAKGNRALHYEPDFEDIEVRQYGRGAGFHMPVWMIEDLIASNAFDNALRESIVASRDPQNEKKLDQEGYDLMMTAFKARKEEEGDTLIGGIRKRLRDKEARAEGTKKSNIEKAKAKAEQIKGAERSKIEREVEEKLTSGNVS